MASIAAVTAIGARRGDVLAGGAAAGGIGDGGTPIQHGMKGPSGEIIFQGDWCSTTNGPATSTCSDAVQFTAGFAASGVTIQ